VATRSVPAFKGRQGGREFFQALMSNELIAEFFAIEFDDPEEPSQRPLQDKHARDIGDYMVAQQDDYVLGTLVYAVGRSPNFRSIDGAFGELELDASDLYRSIDGQHRHKGITYAIDNDEDIANDVTSVLIYVEPDFDRRRQMFADMNGKAKRVTKSQNILFDSRDTFARVARRLSLEPPLMGHVEMQKASPARGSQSWVTLVAIDQAVKALQIGIGTPRDRNFDEMVVYQDGKEFFEMLAATRPELQTIASGAADISALRAESILVSSTTIRVLAAAIHDCLRRDGANARISSYADALARMDFRPANRAWVRCGFIVEGKTTPQARTQEMRQASIAMTDMLEL
jgi:DGQHR domain-containing protein